MKKYLALGIIFNLFFLLACATQEKSAVKVLVEASNPIDAMVLPERSKVESKAKMPSSTETTIEIKAGTADTQEQKEVIDPGILDKIPEKPIIQQVRIDANKVRLRKGPGLQFKILGKAFKGDLFKLLGEQKDPESVQTWYLVEDEEGEKYFVSSLLASVIETTEKDSAPGDKHFQTISLNKETLQKRKTLSSAKVRSLVDSTPPLPPELKKAKHITLNFEGTEIYDVITTFCELRFQYRTSTSFSSKFWRFTTSR
jgi:uncharacterized protein YgiM (DUF1202 family)